MNKVWEPIGYIGFVENTLLYTNDHGDAIQRLSIGTGAPHEVVLPDNVRLCRLVDAPDTANAEPVQVVTIAPTAQEFVDKCYERRGELLRAGFTGGANTLDGIAFLQVMRAMGLQG